MFLSYLSLVLITFFTMELVANLSHRYLMHGNMWNFHEDHHQKDIGFFEKNDIFFVIFAVPAMLLIMGGFFFANLYAYALGLGITIYGICYFLVHDVYIHRRFKFLDKVSHPYLEALKRAHKDHHSHIHKEHGENFGMLWVPLKYYFQR
jgi:beta-carotene 3-hydroxylase